MATSATTSPVTREMSAYVRDRGLRSILATLTGGVVVLRAKGLRSEETLEISALYSLAVKQRLAREKAERKAARKKK